MTLEQFKYLSEPDQNFLLDTKAVFLAAIEDNEGSYSLFQVDGFYLEVFCSSGKRTADFINYFDETYLLEPYLQLIDISPIYNILGNGKMS